MWNRTLAALIVLIASIWYGIFKTPTKMTKVLLTGANGYIAAWAVSQALEQGFSVRGTVRSQEKAALLKEALKEFGDKAEFVVVNDITAVRFVISVFPCLDTN